MGDLKYEFMKCENKLDQTYFKEEALINLINLSEEHTSNSYYFIDKNTMTFNHTKYAINGKVSV